MGTMYSRIQEFLLHQCFDSAMQLRVAGFGLILPQNLQVENARMEDWIPAVSPVTFARKN